MLESRRRRTIVTHHAPTARCGCNSGSKIGRWRIQPRRRPNVQYHRSAGSGASLISRIALARRIALASNAAGARQTRLGLRIFLRLLQTTVVVTDQRKIKRKISPTGSNRCHQNKAGQ
jgi:hypothetical protein